MAIISDKAMQATPGAVDKWLIEDGARGAGRFVGRITPAGARTFYFRYTGPDGDRVRLLIGSYDARGDGRATFTVQQARDRARELSAMYRSGIVDLRGHLEAERQAVERAAEAQRLQAEAAAQAAADAAAAAARRLTVRQLFDQWQLVELTPRTLADGTRTGRKDGGAWVKDAFDRRVFPKLGDIPAEDVRKAELLAITDACRAEGKLRTANVLFTDLRQMFRFALEREIVARNPLDGIKRSSIGGKDTERDRVLDDRELKQLWKSVPTANLSSRSAAAIWLILGTACRVGEAMAAKWEHVDLEKGTWYLPETKNERDHTIHLSPFALRHMQALAQLKEADPAGKQLPWVFPNANGDGHVCIKSFGKQLADRQRPTEKKPMSGRTKRAQSLALAGGRWTAHDLRRTAATILARLGISTDVIDECLNHKLQSKVARVYIKDRRMADQGRAFDALGAHLDAIFSGVAESNVVQMAQRAA